MTKSSVDRKLSKYGNRFNLRYHIKEEIYNLSDSQGKPMLIAVYHKNERNLAISAWERLEALNNENQTIKNTIMEAYETERTSLGKSVLKQLLEAIQ